jgi:hypothetical protein
MLRKTEMLYSIEKRNILSVNRTILLGYGGIIINVMLSLL